MKSNLIVEFGNARNSQIHFRPLGKTLRGRFDVRQMPDGGDLYSKWPEPIPGQRIQLDIGTGEAAVIEPLYDAEHVHLREKIERAGYALPPQRENVKADPATWLFWIKSLVGTGDAKLIQGELPAKIDGTPKVDFYFASTPDPLDKLTAALVEHNTLLSKLLAKLVSGTP